MLTELKDPSPKNSRVGAVYKMECAECPASYFGETGRTLECRIKEHKRCVTNKDTSNGVAVHHLETKHQMNWEGASCLEFVCFWKAGIPSAKRTALIIICREMPGAYLSLEMNARTQCERTHAMWTHVRDHAIMQLTADYILYQMSHFAKFLSQILICIREKFVITGENREHKWEIWLNI